MTAQGGVELGPAGHGVPLEGVGQGTSVLARSDHILQWKKVVKVPALSLLPTLLTGAFPGLRQGFCTEAGLKKQINPVN